MVEYYRNLSHSIYGNEGNLPPLLITHGLLGSKQNWNSIAKAIAKVSNRQVVVYDARNHGDSPHTTEHSYEVMAEDVLHLAKALNIEKFSFLGHSMGGRTGMVLALRNPQILEKVVIVDVSPVSLQSAFHTEMKGYLKAMMSMEFKENLSLSNARKIGNDKLAAVVKEPSVRAFILTNLAESEGKIHWKPNLPVLLKSIENIGSFPQDLLSKQFNQPSLFIRGENSTYIPDEDIPEIKKLFPSAEFVTIKNAGHWPHADNVKEFLDALISFI